MRLWSVHPKYLDRQAMGSVWREGLGAIKSIKPGAGYHHHSALDRFKIRLGKKFSLQQSRLILHSYLYAIHQEACTRGYNYNLGKIKAPLYSFQWPNTIPVTKGQVEYEIKFLWHKLKERSCPHFKKNIKANNIQLHPSFYLIDGDIEPWEKVKVLK